MRPRKRRTAVTTDAELAPFVLRSQCGEVLSVAFVSDKIVISSSEWEDSFRIWDIDSRVSVGTLGRTVDRLVVSADRKLIASFGSTNLGSTIRLWFFDESRIFDPGPKLEAIRRRIRYGAFSPDGSHLVGGCDDGALAFWDTAEGELLAVVENAHEGVVSSVAFSPDGTQILSGSYISSMRLWAWNFETRTVNPVVNYRVEDQDLITGVAFSPDGQFIASGSSKTARIWDAETGELLLTLPIRDYISRVVFDPTSKFIVTASGNGAGRIWNATTGEAVGVLAGHGHMTNSLDFSPDGTRVVSGSSDGSIRVWNWVDTQG